MLDKNGFYLPPQKKLKIMCYFNCTVHLNFYMKVIRNLYEKKLQS